MGMTLEELEILSHRPYVPLPTLSGFDPDNPYYAFLYHLGQAMGPCKVLEIGTDKGDGAAHLAAARADNQVWTVDQVASETITEHLAPFPNATFIHANVNGVPDLPNQLRALGPFDIFFEDGEHSGGQVTGEWEHYVPLVRSGGIILMDDINLPTGIREVWDAIAYPKIELNHLHNTGFGAVIIR